jgi:hypothetical protein
MADIDQIIAGGSGAGTTADFSGIPKILDYYYKGKDEAAKNDLREAFKGGVPLTSDGQPDFASMAKTLFQKGGLSEGMAAAGQGLAQQQLQYGQKLAQDAFPTGAPVSAAPAGTAVKPLVSPSVSRATPIPGNAPVRGASPQGDQPGSIVGLISAAGIPDELAGPYIAQISAATKTDPNSSLDPQTSSRVQQIVQAAVQRLRSGQPPGGAPQQPQAAQAPPQMQPPQQPDFNQRFNAARPGQGSDPTLGGLVPAGRTPQQQIAGLSQAISSGMLKPDQAKVYQAHIDAITKALEPTGPMKEYDKAVQQGFKGTLEDWQNRTDDNTTQRDILTKSTIPRLEKSQDKATSSIEDIDAIHRSRIELDQPGGVITGAWASDRLKLAKIGNYLGIPNADEITNTEAFSAAVGKRVAAMVKAFGSGTAISDGDRRFAEKMAGGGIELNETSMRRILDIGEQADRAIIDRHNEFADKAVKSNEGLKSARDTFIVQQPGQYKKPGADASFPRFSSPSDVKAAVSSGKLKSGDAFLTSDGRTKYVP